MRLTITLSNGIKNMHTFNSICRSESVYECSTSILNGSSLVHEIKLTPKQHNELVDAVVKGDGNIDIVYDYDGEFTVTGVTPHKPCVMTVGNGKSNTVDVSMSVYETIELVADLSDDGVDFTPHIDWYSNSSLIVLENTNSNVVSITAMGIGNAVVTAKLRRTNNVVTFNITSSHIVVKEEE